VETNYLNAGFREWTNSFIDVSTRKQTTIRDEQRAPKVQLTRKLAELLDHASAKHHSRPRLKIETLHKFWPQKGTKSTNDE
jgi:hypothetical protein